MTTCFGDYALDEARRELLYRGTAVHLTAKAYELLLLLIERRPAAVSKAEIHDRLWPGTFVSEVNLPTLVFEIRSAIADAPHEPGYIRTVRGFGYAFCGALNATPDAPGTSGRPVQRRLIWGDREIALREGDNILGRTPEAVAWVDHGSVSRRHARLSIRGGEVLLEDLGSRHGTFVDGERVEGPTLLRDGARIRLGSVSMVYRTFAPAVTDSKDA